MAFSYPDPNDALRAVALEATRLVAEAVRGILLSAAEAGSLSVTTTVISGPIVVATVGSGGNEIQLFDNFAQVGIEEPEPILIEVRTGPAYDSLKTIANEAMAAAGRESVDELIAATLASLTPKP